MAVEPFTLTQGRSPLLVSMPHSGTYLPPGIESRLTPAALALPDTDWHIPELYDFLEGMDASVLVASHSRYFVDLNRDPDSKALYPGADNTELCPTTTFAQQAIYQPGQAPTSAEVEERREAVWRPYHAALAEELASLRAEFGYALLWDAHSIKSQVERFFDGRLPDLNLGTGDGASAHADLLDLLGAVARDAEESLGYSHAINGRFKGGYITRYHGRPRMGVHAVQLELSQITYMDEAAPYGFREDLAGKIRPVLAGLLQAMMSWAEMEALPEG